jgi:hypothetical protein
VTFAGGGQRGALMLGLDTPGQPPLPYLSRPQHWLIDTTENKGLGVCPRPSSFKLLLLGGLLEMPLHVALVDAGCAVPIFELTATAWRKHGNAWGCGLDGNGCMSAVIATTGGNRDLPATVISPPTNIRRQTGIDVSGFDLR